MLCTIWPSYLELGLEREPFAMRGHIPVTKRFYSAEMRYIFREETCMSKGRLKYLLITILLCIGSLCSCTESTTEMHTQISTNEIVNSGLSSNYNDENENEETDYLLITEHHSKFERGLEHTLEHTILYVYDEKGEVIKKSWYDSRNLIQYNAAEYEYDINGNIIECIERNTPSHIETHYTCTYNEAGELSTKTEFDTHGDVSTFSEYENGKVVKETHYSSDGSIWWLRCYTYDTRGNLISQFDKKDDNSEPYNQYVYDYDDNSNVIHETHNESHSGYSHEYVYDSAGNVLSDTYETYKSGERTIHTDTVTYDGNGNIIEIATYKEDGTPIEVCKMLYDNAGNCIEIDDYDSQQSLQQKSLREFDSRGNLIRQGYYKRDGSYAGCQEYAYDNNDHLLLDKCAVDGLINHWYEYTYDQHGNTTSYTEYDEDGTVSEHIDYQYVPVAEYQSDHHYILLETAKERDFILAGLTRNYWCDNARRIAYQSLYRFYSDNSFEYMSPAGMGTGSYDYTENVLKLSFSDAGEIEFQYDDNSHSWVSEKMISAGEDSEGYVYDIPLSLSIIDDISWYVYYDGSGEAKSPQWREPLKKENERTLLENQAGQATTLPEAAITSEEKEQIQDAIFFYVTNVNGSWCIYDTYGYTADSSVGEQINYACEIFRINGNPSYDDIKANFIEKSSKYMTSEMIQSIVGDMDESVKIIDGVSYYVEGLLGGDGYFDDDSFRYTYDNGSYTVELTEKVDYGPNEIISWPYMNFRFVKRDGKLLMSSAENA